MNCDNSIITDNALPINIASFQEGDIKTRPDKMPKGMNTITFNKLPKINNSQLGECVVHHKIA